MSNSIIEARNITHQFGDFTALHQLNLQIRQGEIYGLLGPNGAGKTTTIRLLNGLYTPASGELRVFGLDPAEKGAEIRRQTGVLTETSALYERLTARQNLEFFGAMAGMSSKDIKARTHELLSFFEIEDRADARTGTYSKGMKQRLALARALFHRPKLVFLDEPTSGLDPESALQVRELIETICRRDGQTVFLCTHQLIEAERLCDHLTILNHGHTLANGSLEELARQVAPGMWVEIDLWQDGPADLGQAVEAAAGVRQVETAPRALRIQVNDQSVVPEIINRCVRAGAQILRVQPRSVSLEEIYFKLQQGQENQTK